MTQLSRIMSRSYKVALGAILAVLAFAIPAAGASASVIDFEGLSDGTVVNDEYAGQGVTFNNPKAFTYAPGTNQPIPGFAHSGTVAIEQCFAIEFCTSPIEATVTSPQRVARVFVGASFPAQSPVDVKLTAFDSSGNVAGSDTATLQPLNPPAPIPVDTELLVDAGTKKITELQVTTVGNGGYMNGIAVDDVEFSSPGAPPPPPVTCPTTVKPVVTLTSPAPGSYNTVQHDGFRLAGTITRGGAPLSDAQVIVKNTDTGTTRTANIYTTLVGPDGGGFGPTSMHGLLTKGNNTIEVTATNCAGTTSTSDAGAPPRIFYNQPVPSLRFRQLSRIEVTQGIQTPDNKVPLFARSANWTKQTFARVYLRTEDDDPNHFSDQANVTGTLTATRPDGTRPDGPLRVTSLLQNGRGAYIEEGQSLVDARDTIGNSLVFQLPPEWLDEGRLHLTLEHIYVDGVQSTRPCIECDNLLRFPTGATAPSTVKFRKAPPLRIHFFTVPWRTAAGQPLIEPAQTDIGRIVSYLRRTYPTSDFRFSQTQLPIAGGALIGAQDPCDDVNPLIGNFLRNSGRDLRTTRYYGVISDNGTALSTLGIDSAGCSPRGDYPYGSGYVGTTLTGNGAVTAAHEIAHMFDRDHISGGTRTDCGSPSNTDGSYPHPSALIGDSQVDAQGFDAGDSFFSISMGVKNWRDDVSDLQSYCGSRWISDYTYKGILKQLCERESAACPDKTELFGRSTASGVQRFAPRATAKRALIVGGTVELASGELSLEPLQIGKRRTLTPSPKRSKYAVVLLDRSGKRIARHPFRPALTDEDDKNGLALVDAVVPFKKGTTEVEIVRGRKVLESIEISDHAPTVKLAEPEAELEDSVKLRWRSADADGGKRTYTVLYSPEGDAFTPIAIGLTRTSYVADLTELPGGEETARFKVVANDGVLTGSDTTDYVTVPAQAPVVTISTTASEVPADTATVLTASVLDAQDIRFNGENVVWSSSVQGELGRGISISAELMPGTHEITATATNSAGVATIARITVTATAGE
jgi:hypothetical protein